MTLMIYENDRNPDNHKLIELCLNSNYFIFDNRVRILQNSRPIGLVYYIGSFSAAFGG